MVYGGNCNHFEKIYITPSHPKLQIIQPFIPYSTKSYFLFAISVLVLKYYQSVYIGLLPPPEKKDLYKLLSIPEKNSDQI